MAVESPQQRRRKSLARKALFTAAQSAVEVQRAFLFRQQMVFTLGALAGLALMWVVALKGITPIDPAAFGLIALGVGLALWLLSSVLRLKNRPAQIVFFFLGFLALGASAGSLLGSSSVNRLLNPSLLVGVTLTGSLVNTLLFKTPRTPFIRFLLVTPWFAAACAVAWFFPASEWVLALSGLVAAIFAFLLQFTAEETLNIYQPREYLTAAADILPIFFVSAWHGWTGQS